jgi:hypothetical protein
MHRETFFNFTDDEVFYDERKKRYVYLKNARMIDMQEYRGKHFKHQRPDFYGTDRVEFNNKLKKGQTLARQMLYQCKLEMRRLWRVMPGTGF